MLRRDEQGRGEGVLDGSDVNGEVKWHIYAIDHDLSAQHRIGVIEETKEGVASLIGRAYERNGEKYLIIAAFALSPSNRVLWHEKRGRYIHPNEIHCLRIPESAVHGE